MILAVTGHRPDKLGGYDDATNRKLTDFAIAILGESKPDAVITGMALGWDQAVASACISLGIPFTAAIPFRGQESRWPELSKLRYRHLLGSAAKSVVVCPGGFSAASMQARNIWMVDHADQVLALWNGSSGGTANCVRYAKSRGVVVANCWPLWVAFAR